MSNDSSNQGPISKRKRFFKLANMTASVAGNYAKTRIKSMFQSDEDSSKEESQTHAKSGEIIAQTLGELKGAAMKIGQMASVAGDILPRELANALKTLQNEAPPMPYDVIAAQIEAELGAPPEVLFNRFEKTPFASASIGQVHRAQVDDGREVVVKVQYPGVDQSVDSDLSHLKFALRASGLIKIDKKALNALFEELRARLTEELDYCNEADNVRKFRKYHSKHDFVIIPQVVGERSSKRVLTLTYEHGDNINSLDDEGYSQEVRDTITHNLFQLTLNQIFDLQSIHADPNPANYAFRPDGRIVLYDFGCIKNLKPEIVSAYRDTLWSGVNEDYDGVENGLLRLKVRNPQGPEVALSYYKIWRDTIFGPFEGGKVFDYGNSDLHARVKALFPTAIKHVDSFLPPVEVVFIDRVIAGHYGNLRIIGGKHASYNAMLPYLRGDAIA